ncbi:MAG: hypothetical protein GX640_04600 [Fibrobacter sp.]|nr:hypothetical protein [Fibrobacter sp.]
MGKLILSLGRRLMISNTNHSVRHGFILFFTYLLLAGGVIFSFEIILILLGVGDVFIPWTNKVLQLILRIF